MDENKLALGLLEVIKKIEEAQREGWKRLEEARQILADFKLTIDYKDSLTKFLLNRGR
jgi:hypothetical protein